MAGLRPKSRITGTKLLLFGDFPQPSSIESTLCDGTFLAVAESGCRISSKPTKV
jgi:hypothetical protein